MRASGWLQAVVLSCRNASHSHQSALRRIIGRADRLCMRSYHEVWRHQRSLQPDMQSSSAPSSGNVSTEPLAPVSATSPLPAFSTMAHPTGPPSTTPLPYIPLTLVLCLRPSASTPSSLQVLLGLKKRGFGAGRYNGFGGKLQADETVHQAAARELHEECGLQAQQLDAVGVVVQRFLDRPDKQPLVIHVLRCERWQGDVAESEEMAPVWLDEDEVPYDKMWVDDRDWYPLLFRGQRFVADYVLEGMDRVVDGGVNVCSVEQLQQWNWEQHSSEQWRATVKFDKLYRESNNQLPSHPT